MRKKEAWMWMGLALVAPSSLAAQLPANWTEPFDPVQIADNLYYVGSAGLSAFLLTSDEGHILIDAPMRANTSMIIQNVRALGFDPRDIQIHLVTHAHYDHVGGLADLLLETGGQLLASDADAEFIANGRDFGLDTDGYPPANVSQTLSDMEEVRLGDLTLTAHVTAGHTPGCTSWTGVTTIEGTAFKFLLVCSLSALSDYRLGGDDPTYSGQAGDFCQSLSHLKSLDSDIFLSNHEQFFGLKQKAAERRTGNHRAFVNRTDQGQFLETAAMRIDRALSQQGLAGC